MENIRLQKPNEIVIKKAKLNRKSKIKSSLRKKFFISTWICNYNAALALSDLIAGITLGLTIIPESIACALLAGLPSHYGLYSAFIGPIIYLIFGTVEKVIIGPTSLVALVTVQFTIGKPMEFAFILTLLAGFVELLMGIFRLANTTVFEVIENCMKGLSDVLKRKRTECVSVATQTDERDHLISEDPDADPSTDEEDVTESLREEDERWRRWGRIAKELN